MSVFPACLKVDTSADCFRLFKTKQILHHYPTHINLVLKMYRSNGKHYCDEIARPPVSFIVFLYFLDPNVLAVEYILLQISLSKNYLNERKFMSGRILFPSCSCIFMG
jgi:hypothetical protein